MAPKKRNKQIDDDANHLQSIEQLSASGLFPGLEVLPTVVLVLDKRTLRVAFANAAAESILELSRKQLQLLRWEDLFTNADELVATIDAIADNRFQATHLDAALERPGHELFGARQVRPESRTAHLRR